MEKKKFGHSVEMAGGGVAGRQASATNARGNSNMGKLTVGSD